MNLDISSQECLAYQKIMTYTISILGTWLHYSRTITAINTLACMRVTINHSLSKQRLVAENREVLMLSQAIIVNDAPKNGESMSNVKNIAYSSSLFPN